MKLLTAQQFRDWDAYTIRHEPITSIDLMERAAKAVIADLAVHFLIKVNEKIKIFCGPGNNGGDGLAVARLLADRGEDVMVFILSSSAYSTDFTINAARLEEQGKVPVVYMSDTTALPMLSEHDLVIDALFGTGLKRALDGLALKVVQHINRYGKQVVAIDVPSGLGADLFSPADLDEDKIIHAHHTLTFQLPKQSFLHAETFPFTGEFHVLDIGLKEDYLDQVETNHFYLAPEELPAIKLRQKFAHKGHFGHALCVGGSYGKIGAALLMSKACLRTGAGLVTAFVPKVGYTILQGAFPECMVLTDDELYEIRNFPITADFDAIAVGPGLGMHEYTIKNFHKWLPSIGKPCVIDADALNIIAGLLATHHNSFRFPANAILTPHPKEFDRLAGVSKSSMERLEKQVHFAQRHQVHVVLKGAHTSIATPSGNVFFNSTGNPAMATAGSGDALTGVITSLLAQGYHCEDAALLGVYLHGFAGNLAAENKATITASDLIGQLPVALYRLTERF